MRKNLTDRALKALKPAATRYHVGDSVVRGLRVRVSPDGAKIFSAVYRGSKGKARTFTIGRYDEISLADARDLARDIKAGARFGQDAQEEKIASRKAARAAVNFAELAERFLKARTPNLASTTRTEYQRIITRYILESPVNSLSVKEVKRRDFRALLEEIAGDAPVMANRVFQLVRAVCRWSMREELLDADPSAGLERPRREKSRDRVLSDTEVSALWRSLDEHMHDEPPCPLYRPRWLL